MADREAVICGPRRWRRRFTVRTGASGTFSAAKWDDVRSALSELGIPWGNVEFENDSVREAVLRAWGDAPGLQAAASGRMAALPKFEYHPDPVGTGAIVRSGDACDCCGQRPGMLYLGPVYSADEVEFVCPWCIADGRAAAAFDATFTDVAPLPDGVPSEVIDEILHRTPGFAGWQQERWLFHCGDGAAFLGRVGRAELQHHPDALAMLAADGHPRESIEALATDGEATGYLFQCRSCGTHLAYADYL